MIFTNDQGTRFICLNYWEHASYGTWDTDCLRDIQIHRYYWNEPHPSIVYIHVYVCGGGVCLFVTSYMQLASISKQWRLCLVPVYFFLLSNTTAWQ